MRDLLLHKGMTPELRLTRTELLKMLMCNLRRLIDEKNAGYSILPLIHFRLQLSFTYMYVMRDGLIFHFCDA